MNAEVGDRRSRGDAVRLAQRLGHAERVDAIDHAALHVGVVGQIGGAIHQVAGDASAAEHHLMVVRVDRDGAAVDPAGDHQVGPDIDQAFLAWAGAGEGVGVLQEFRAGGERPGVRHGLAGAGDADGLPALETVGADLNRYRVEIGRQSTSAFLAFKAERRAMARRE